LAFFLLTAVGAVAVSKPVRIEVLSAQTEFIALDDENNGAPIGCSLPDYSAYCHHSRSAIVLNRMSVRDGSGKSFTVACTVDSVWSKCAALPVGGTFEARQEKSGITVFYRDQKGKQKKQFFRVVASAPAPQSEDSESARPVDESEFRIFRGAIPL